MATWLGHMAWVRGVRTWPCSLRARPHRPPLGVRRARVAAPASRRVAARPPARAAGAASRPPAGPRWPSPGRARSRPGAAPPPLPPSHSPHLSRRRASRSPPVVAIGGRGGGGDPWGGRGLTHGAKGHAPHLYRGAFLLRLHPLLLDGGLVLREGQPLLFYDGSLVGGVACRDLLSQRRWLTRGQSAGWGRPNRE